MTKKSKRTQLIFWLIIIGLLISMLIAFTPTLNGLFGGGQQAQQQGEPALVVNGETIYSLEVAQAQQNPPFNMGFQGEVGDDLNLLLADSLIGQAVSRQAAGNIRVSDNEVRARLNEFREQQGLAGASNDTAYLNFIQQYGFSDATFRDYWRDQIRFERYRDDLTKDVTVSDAEVQAFYDLNKDNYQSEEKVKARQIVVSDQAKADEVLAKAKAGEDFGTLAKDNSEELADRNGALGAASGSTDPQPVGAAALPGAVSQAAFALQGPGITDVIPANEKFYIVSVEEFVPAAARPFEEVKQEVTDAALEVKKQGVLESSFAELREKANIEVPANSVLTYDNPAVAKVGETEIKKADLVSAVYSSQQIQQALQPGMEQIITGLFKPSYLEQLIDREVAYQGAQTIEGATFFGGKSQIAQQALQYVSRDATATPEELQTFYDENIESRFTIPASAVANRIDFPTQEAATAFRAAMVEGGTLQETAEANGGIITDLGTVQAGSLPTELDTALFGTDAFDTLPNSEETISDILVVQEPVEEPVTEEATTEDTSAEDTPEEDTNADGTTAEPSAEEPTTKDVYVVLVGTRTPEEVRPFDEVKVQVEQEVLGQKRAELQRSWIDEVKATVPVENLLPEPTPPAAPEPTFETTPLPGATDETPADSTETPAEGTAPTEEVAPEETATEENTTAEPATEENTTEESTSEESTTEETPAEETPAEETPAEETPAEETPEESSTTNETSTSEETEEPSTTESTSTSEETPADSEETSDSTPSTQQNNTPSEGTTEETPTNETDTNNN